MAERKRLILKERPVPREGITVELFGELLTDRAKFINGVSRHMRKESPFLWSFTMRTAAQSPRPDLTLNWMLLYYEIFSRSAREQGAIIQIEETIIKTVLQETLDESNTLGELSDELRIDHYVRMNENLGKDAFDEIKNNGELFDFWSALIYQEVSMKEEINEFARTVYQPIYLMPVFFKRSEEIG